MGTSVERLPLLGTGSIQGGNGETGDGHTGKTMIAMSPSLEHTVAMSSGK